MIDGGEDATRWNTYHGVLFCLGVCVYLASFKLVVYLHKSYNDPVVSFACGMVAMSIMFSLYDYFKREYQGA